MTLDVGGSGDGGVVGVDVHGVPQGNPHLPPALLAQLVQSDEKEELDKSLKINHIESACERQYQ